MIYTPLTQTAMKIAYEAHAGQVDKGGNPYIYHPMYVAEQMENERLVTIALLHDVLEDSSFTAEDLVQAGIPEDLVSSVQLLSRDKGVSYREYIDRIIASGNMEAMKVKYQDLLHNSNEDRLGAGRLPSRLRDRYAEARLRMEEALGLPRTEEKSGQSSIKSES